MINDTLLTEIIEDQLERFKARDAGISRDILYDKYLKTDQIYASFPESGEAVNQLY
jgi:hypothetical protein